MKTHLATHVMFDIDKAKVVTHDGIDLDTLQTSTSIEGLWPGHLDGDNSLVNKAESKLNSPISPECQIGDTRLDITNKPGIVLSIYNFLSKADFPYTCLICNVKFILLKQLRKHRYVQHCHLTDFFVRFVGNKHDMQLKLTKNLPDLYRMVPGEMDRIDNFIKSGENREWVEEVKTQLRQESRKIEVQEWIRLHPEDEKRVEEYIKSGLNSTWIEEMKNQMRAEKKRERYKSFKEKRKMCEVCGMMCSYNTLKRHEIMHSGEIFECDICHLQLADAKILENHKLIHFRSESDRKHVCELCGRAFWKIGHLNQHLKTHAADRDNFRVKCETCHLLFKSRKEYTTHLRNHKKDYKISCDVCGDKFSSMRFLRIHTSTQHKNSEYYRLIQRRAAGNLWKSEKEKSLGDMVGVSFVGGKPKCTFCNKVYKAKQNLLKHMKMQHTYNPPVACNICGKTFRCENTLQRHQIVHSDMRPFKCHICHKAFKYRGALYKHMTTHSTEKPHKCDVCHRGFSHINYLRNHYMIHTGEKPHKCQVCGQAFRQKGDHLQHLKKHAERGECSLVTTTNSYNYNVLVPTNITYRGYMQATEFKPDNF